MPTNNSESSAVHQLIELAAQQAAFSRHRPGESDWRPKPTSFAKQHRRPSSVAWWEHDLEHLALDRHGRWLAPSVVGTLIVIGVVIAGYVAVGRGWVFDVATLRDTISAPLRTDASVLVRTQPRDTAAAAATAIPARITTTITSRIEPTRAAAPDAAESAAVLIESTPSGATVMLVDRGKSSLLGNTPLSAGVDPARRYELIFISPDRPARVTPFDPSTTKHVKIALDRAQPEVKAADVAPATRENATAKSRRTAKAAEPEPTTSEARGATAGDGVLMISSKPPCSILIDGQPTGLTTPQRSISLPPGRHQVTLVNSAENIERTIVVEITAGSTTKVIRDFMIFHD